MPFCTYLQIYVLLTTNKLVQLQVSICGIYGERSGSGTVCSLSTSVFPCHYHPTQCFILIQHRCYTVLATDSFVKYHTQLCISMSIIINSLFRKASFTQFCRVEPQIFPSSELQKIFARPPPRYFKF